MKNGKLYHVMFLPTLGGLDHDFWFNVLVMLIFIGVYFWHTHHDHEHNKELLEEVKKIREEMQKKTKD